MKRLPRSRILLLSLLGLVVCAVAGERLLSLWIEQRLDQWAVSKEIVIGSMTVSVAGRSIHARDIQWSSKPQTNSQQDTAHVRLEKLSITGIGLFQLVRNKAIDVRAVVAENGVIFATARQPTDSSSARQGGIADSTKAFGGFHVETVQLINTTMTYRPDSVTTWSTMLVNLTLRHVELQDAAHPKSLSSYNIKGAVLSLAKLSRKQIGGFFSLAIGRIDFDRETHSLSCDSLSVIPAYPKLEYAHKRGTQSTWAAVLVPRIEINGLDLKQHADSTLTASHVLLQGVHIDAFRDRRVPFRRKSEMPLPMKWLKELHLALEIDSLQVADMEVVYEHVAEDGFEPGKLSFTKLEGMFININNRLYDNLPRVTTLSASALIMGTGKLEAQFTFPLDAGTPYTAKGKITNLPLAALNPMIENAAFVSVESGQLNELSFQFHYNNDVSRGNLSIDYNDLKVKGLHKNRAGDAYMMKTLVANTALKNNNSSSGVIFTQRDKRRFVIHYWAASLMDGIRNAVLPSAANPKAKGAKGK